VLKTNCIGHIIRRNIIRRNWLLHDGIEREMKELKGVGTKAQRLDDLENRRRYWALKEEAEDRKRWKQQFITRT
jgi:hypothetical protein